MRKLFAIIALIVCTVAAQAATYYVSTDGNNSDGTSWANAWDELDQIPWASINAGDTVYIDGGAANMYYYTQMEITNCTGTTNNRIMILKSMEGGHDGTAHFRGPDWQYPIPYMGGEGSYSGPNVGGQDGLGIDFEQNTIAWLTIDGQEWSGIKIYGWRGRAGIHFDQENASGNDYITLRNIEIYDCGSFAYPGEKGICVGAGQDNLTLERLIIHDCAQDGIQGRGPQNNWVIRRCWFYNSRPSAADSSRVFNDGRHHDAVQIFSGGLGWGPIIVEDTIIGPNFNQGWFPTESGTCPYDVTLTNCLFIGPEEGQWQGNLDKDSSNTVKNWNWYNCTFIANYTGTETNHIIVRGTGHDVHGCIFQDGRNLFYGGSPTNSDCMTFEAYDGVTLGLVEDPAFADDSFVWRGTDPNDWPDPLSVFGWDWDFTPTNSNCGYGDGTNPTMGVDNTMVTMSAFFGGLSSNIAPQVNITSPANNTIYVDIDREGEYGPITVTATASDVDGSVASVTFYIGDEQPVEDTAAPYTGSAILPTGTHTIRATAEDNEGKQTSVQIQVYIQPVLSGLVWEAEAGALTSPMEAVGGLVFQGIATETYGTGGSLVIYFETDDEVQSDYIVRCYVNAVDSGSNSVWVDIDAVPSALEIWDVIVTAGIEERTVSHRGSGTPDVPDTDPMIWSLDPGVHYIRIDGRESNCSIDSIEVYFLGETDPDPDPDPDPPDLPPPSEGPTIQLGGNSIVIDSGDTTASILDGTDFGEVSITGFYSDGSFTIQNTGDEDLNLTGTPYVSISGTHAVDFSIINPPQPVIAPMESQVFTIRFDSSAIGIRSATVSISSNDALVPVHTFVIQGTGRDDDTDRDGLTDSEESVLGTNPNNPDSDQDTVSDGLEVNLYETDPLDSDSDDDGMPDGWEITYNFDPNLASDAILDFDSDGFSNSDEFTMGTDPTVSNIGSIEEVVEDLLDQYESCGAMGNPNGAMLFLISALMALGCVLRRRQ